MSLLRILNINAAYGQVRILSNLSLDVNKGEVVALVGVNGSGKSTLVKSITGFVKATEGTIIFENQRIDNLEPYRIAEKGISLIPEGRKLFSSMTVEENLIVGSYLPEAKKYRRESIKWLMDIFPILKNRRTQIAGTLSGGEQQMLAIGRGLMSRPKLLILDEPSLGLAPRFVNLILETISKINAEGMTVLLVEQNVVRSLRLANRGYILESGSIVMEGSGQELLENPHTKSAYLGL